MRGKEEPKMPMEIKRVASRLRTEDCGLRTQMATAKMQLGAGRSSPQSSVLSPRSIQINVPDRLRGVPFRLFEELLELAVQDVFLGLFGFDRCGELLFPLRVLAFQGSDRVVDRAKLSRRLGSLVIDDRFEGGIDLEAGVAARTEELEVHGISLQSFYLPFRRMISRLSLLSGLPSSTFGASIRSKRRASRTSAATGGVTSS